MNFEKMRLIREDNEMTQNDIANILNVDRTTYTGWETGKDTIPIRKLSKFCDYYNVSIDYIMNFTDIVNYDIINKNIDLNIIGNNLKDFRLKRGLKQKDIFKLLNTTSSTYSAYETGKVLMQTTFIYQIAKEYNLSVDQLLGKTKKL